MLWDLIRDFFVQNIFGGTDSSLQVFSTFLGKGVTVYDGGSEEIFSMGEAFNIVAKDDDFVYLLSLSDWLSTTATIITISFLTVLCFLFVFKIVKLIGGLIRG